MGRGIAYLAAVAGYDAVMFDADAGALDAARVAVDSILRKAVEKGKLTEPAAAEAAARLQIVPELEPRADHASYLDSWLKVLADDKRAIFSAAAHAQRAVAFLHGLQPAASEECEAA